MTRPSNPPVDADRLLTAIAAGLGLCVALAPFAALVILALTGGLMAMLVEPLIGLALLPLAVPFGASLGLPVALASVAAPFAVVGVALVAGMRWITRVGKPSTAPRIQPRPGTRPERADATATDLVAPVEAARNRLWRWGVLPAAVYGGALAAAAWRAPDLDAAATELARWVLYALALALAASLADGPRRGRWLAMGLLAAGALEAGAGLRAVSVGQGPEAFGFGHFQRAFGHFGQPNPFAAYMNMVWPLALALLLSVVGSGSASGRAPAVGARSGAAGARSGSGATARASMTLAGLSLITLTLTLAGLALSFSRGAWLGAAAAGVVMLAVWFGQMLASREFSTPALALAWLASVAGLAWLTAGGVARLPDALGARLAVSATGLAGADVSDAEVTDANFATVERLAHWQAALAMWRDRPWLGQGPGMFPIAYDRFRLPRWRDALGHAHNFYLNTLAESGLVGLGGYLFFILASVALALRAALRPRRTWEAALGLGLVGVLTATAVHSAFDHLYVHYLPIHLGLVVGLTLGARESGETTHVP